jgi:hypothetical protein
MILKGIILASLCYVISLLIHLAVSCFRKGRTGNEPVVFELGRQMRLLAVIWGAAFMVYSLFYFLPLSGIDALAGRLASLIPAAGFIYGMVLYLFLCFLYLTFYYFINRSVSATILEIIDESAQGQLSLEEIKAVYSVEKKYQAELKGMLEGGFIVEESGFYRTALKGRLFGWIAKLTKAYLKLGPGG